jgi:hypothetical protein
LFGSRFCFSRSPGQLRKPGLRSGSPVYDGSAAAMCDRACCWTEFGTRVIKISVAQVRHRTPHGGCLPSSGTLMHSLCRHGPLALQVGDDALDSTHVADGDLGPAFEQVCQASFLLPSRAPDCCTRRSVRWPMVRTDGRGGVRRRRRCEGPGCRGGGPGAICSTTRSTTRPLPGPLECPDKLFRIFGRSCQI